MKKLLPAAALVLAACGSNNPTSSAPPCNPGGGSPLALAVGGVAVFSDPTAMSCVQIPAASGATGYLFIAANAMPGAGGAATYSVAAAATLGVASVGPNVAPATLATSVAQPLGSLDVPTPSTALELHVRTAERRLLNLSVARNAWAAARAAAPTSPSVAPAPPIPGDSLNFHVPRGSSANLCTNFDTIRAVVKTVGTHGIIVQDTAAPAGGFTQSQFDSLETEFDTYTYPTDTSYFGRPTDLDNNGHVFILYTPKVNALTPKGSATYFAGFFFGGDLFPNTPWPTGCPESNVGEIVYLLVPDPSGQFSIAHSTAQVRQITRSVAAHEVEHMINLGVRITNNSPTQESVWLDEVLAHFAEEYVGRAEDGFGPFQRLNWSSITTTTNPNDYNAFYRSNLANLRTFLQRPDTASSIANTDAILADGGAAWTLMHYAADQYAGGNLPSLTLRLVAGPDSGLGNLTSKVSVSFDSLMAGWMVALYADGLGISGLASRYTFSSWNYRDAETQGSIVSYPLLVTPLAAGGSVATQALPGSGTYFTRASSPSTPAGVFRLLAANNQLVSFPGARLYILRMQ